MWEFFLCHGGHRETNRHSREIIETVPAHMRVWAHVEITRNPLSCGGDECDDDSFSLLIHIHTNIHASVSVYAFFFFRIPYSCLPNCLFLLDTGSLGCSTTSCRPCHQTFLPGFHRFSECVCFSWLCFVWLSTEILCLSESVDFLSLLDMYFPVFLVWLVCVCVCVCFCVTVCTGRQTDTVERLAK